MSNRFYIIPAPPGVLDKRYKIEIDGKVVAKSHSPMLTAARILTERGATGRLEMWDHERPYFRCATDDLVAFGKKEDRKEDG